MVLDHVFPPDLRVENEIKTLVGAGFYVTLLSIGPDSRPELESFDGYQIVRSKTSTQVRNKMRGLSGSFPFLAWYVTHQLKKLNRNKPIDAIHAHDLYLFGSCIKAGKSLGIPVVGDMHENWVEALRHYKWSTTVPGKWVVNFEKWQELEDKWSREVDHLIVVIEEMEQRLVENGLASDHLTTVPNTIHLDEFASWPIQRLGGFEEVRPRLVYTGGMDGHRGLEDIIHALPAIIKQHPSVELILVGDGAVKNDLKALVNQMKMDDHVLFTGWQDQEKVKSYMAVCDVGIIPHKKTVHTDHTIPHKLFHYMFMELPCVVSNCKPLERIVKETDCGLVYTSGVAAELAERVNKLLENRDLRLELGQKGARAVKIKYNWDATSKGLIDVYNRLLG